LTWHTTDTHSSSNARGSSEDFFHGRRAL